MTYRYRQEILDELLRHGVRPTDATPPERVHEFVSDLYRYELRRMRQQFRRGAIPRAEYSDRVVDLRRRYPLVSIPAANWVAPRS